MECYLNKNIRMQGYSIFKETDCPQNIFRVQLLMVKGTAAPEQPHRGRLCTAGLFWLLYLQQSEQSVLHQVWSDGYSHCWLDSLEMMVMGSDYIYRAMCHMIPIYRSLLYINPEWVSLHSSAIYKAIKSIWSWDWMLSKGSWLPPSIFFSFYLLFVCFFLLHYLNLSPALFL